MPDREVEQSRSDLKRLRLTRYALDHFLESAVWIDRNGRIVYVNDVTCRDLGYTKEQMLALHVWDIDPTETREKFRERWEYLKEAGEMVIETFSRDRSGRQFPIEVHASYLEFEGETLMVTFSHDITWRRQAYTALRESEEKFRVLTELTPTAVFLYKGTRLIYANPSALKLTGFTAEEILTKNFWDMVHLEYREMVKTYGLARQRGESVPARYEVKYLTKKGEERWAVFTAGAIDYKGEPAGIVSAVDTTDRKLSEIALLDAKAQAELYVDLMGHDINNMNMAALGFLEMACDTLKTREASCSDVLQMIRGAMDSLNSSSNLISSVRKIQRERKGMLQPKVVCLDSLLVEVKGRYEKVPGRDVVITYNAACDCCVRANELLIDVFLNLVGNAIKHSSGPLAIGISLSRTEEDGVVYCRTAVEDTGPGIPDQQKPLIFQRAGREKEKLTGKGVGLYLVRTLVADFKGRVWVEDRVRGDYRKGTRFVVLLPVAADDTGPAGREAHA